MGWFVLVLGIGAAFTAVVAALGLGLAHAMRKSALDIRTAPNPLDLEVAAIGEGRITLRATKLTKNRDRELAGAFGLIGEDAYHEVGQPVEVRANEVVREHRGGRGSISVGDRARLDSFFHEGDPATAHGMAFEEVTVDGPLGPMPAWFVPGSSDIWVVMVHGKGANRREALRILPTLAESGLSCLVMTYRNDEEAPNSHDRWYAYGRHEWEDLEAAVPYALEHGAARIVLFGYSMGGAIVMSFLVKSAFARSVEAVILDAPMLDLRETVAHGAAQAGIPRRVLKYSNRLVSRRYGLDWDEVDYLKRTSLVEPPILLFHGDADRVVPVSTSDALAAALPELVTYVRVPKAGHVLSWNVDRARYEGAVREFLAKSLGRAEPRP